MSQFKYHKYILKSAPYGQLQKVIQNLQKISQFDIESSQSQQTFIQFNEQHLSLIKINGKHQVIILFTTKIQNSHYPIFNKSKDINGQYIDQTNKKAYQINHLTRQLQNQSQIQSDLPQVALDFQQILSSKLHNYVNKYYRQPFGSQVFVEINQQGSLDIHVVFTSKNVQLTNFVTGEWNSIWKINKSKIQGNISIRAHIFESGNVQMNQNKELQTQFQFSQNMQQNATNIIKIIEKFQSKTQSGLSQVYQQMSNGFFKHLRRIAPITKTKMVWNVNALKMNKNLTQGKN